MDRTTELAFASTHVYSRNEVNRAGIPPGWTVVVYQPNLKSGFSAGAFIDAQGHLVTAFTGTDEGVDWKSNIWASLPGSLAASAPQTYDALKFVADTIAANQAATEME